MSSFLQNKQNLILIGELVIVAGITFVIFRKIKNLNNTVIELHKIIASQQEQINKLNTLVESLLYQQNTHIPPQNFNPSQKVKSKQMFTPPSTPPQIPKKTKMFKPTEEEIPKPNIDISNLLKTFTNPFNTDNTLIFNLPQQSENSDLKIEVVEDEEKTEINEDDLDAELEDELKELEQLNLKD
jgi:hypothetical protein